MRRRAFMALLAGGAMAACSFLWPLAAHAQQRVLIIAILGSGAADADASKMQMELLNASMRELGLVDGKDYVLETRWAGSDSSRFPALAAELLALHPAAVVVSTILAARAVQSLSRTVPIVMTGLNDPIAVGLVESLAHPGRNITGVSSMADEIVFKSVEIMREILPQLCNLTAMFNPTNPSNPIMLKTLTNKLANGELSIASIGVRSPADLDSAFTEMSRQQSRRAHRSGRLQPPSAGGYDHRAGFGTARADAREFHVGIRAGWRAHQLCPRLTRDISGYRTPLEENLGWRCSG
jgi:putative tryptophan/tyrosine transport system substrate-binding protein